MLKQVILLKVGSLIQKRLNFEQEWVKLCLKINSILKIILPKNRTKNRKIDQENAYYVEFRFSQIIGDYFE